MPVGCFSGEFDVWCLNDMGDFIFHGFTDKKMLQELDGATSD